MAAIETINLTKRYGDRAALENLSLAVDEGECFGLIGPNGAGKTTLIKILATLLKPTAGEARVAGRSVGPAEARELRARLGYMPDGFGAFEPMAVEEYLAFFAAAHGLHGRERAEAIARSLALTDLEGLADADVNRLSRGVQQRLSVARVLLHDPQVLLLDEPASGLDPRARGEIRELLRELVRMGKTVLIASHILPELAELCHRVGILEQGRLVFQGTLAEARAAAMGERAIVVAVARDPERARALAERVEGVTGIEEEGEALRIRLAEGRADAATTEVAEAIVRAGLGLRRLEPAGESLESAFLRLTKGLLQ